MAPSTTSTVSDCTGKVLNGRYRLKDVIGSGSFGVVYEAIDERIQGDDDNARAVAVKVVSKSNKKFHDPSHLRMEIAIHKRASLLPHVVTLRVMLEDEHFSYLVMDLCRGGSLGQYLQTNGPITDEQRLKTMFLSIVDAVSELHGAGIYHRDIKPGNILLSEDSTEVFLGDFGLATRSEGYSYFAGTRAYMPPELLHPKHNSRPRSEQSDVWALGIVLLNVLSGRAPWPSASAHEPAFFDFVHDPRHLLARFPVSPGLNRVLRRMLRANPAIRMPLPEVRKAIAELDVLLREVPPQPAVPEADISDEGAGGGEWEDVPCHEAHKEEVGGEAAEEGQKLAERVDECEEKKEMLRSTVQSEMDIVAARRARDQAMREKHALACAAAAAMGGSTLDFSPNTAAKAGRKNSGGSKGSSSGKSSTMAVTPDDSDVVVEKRDIGERMREIVARVKFKLRSR